MFSKYRKSLRIDAVHFPIQNFKIHGDECTASIRMLLRYNKNFLLRIIIPLKNFIA